VKIVFSITDVNSVFNDVIPYLIMLGFTQPLTEMITRNKTLFLGSRARPAHKADNVTAVCEPII
jgi:hypothetical protein